MSHSDTLGEVIIPWSSKKMVLACLSGVLIWLACVLTLIYVDTGWSRSNTWLLITLLLLMPIGIAFSLRSIFDARPRIIINRVGLFDRTFKIGTIEWSDLIDAFPWTQRIDAGGRSSEVRYIALKMADPTKYSSRLNWIFRQLLALAKHKAPEPFNICLLGIEYPQDKLLAAIKEHIALHGKY